MTLKYTDDDVLTILERLDAGHGGRTVAADYGVSRSAILGLKGRVMLDLRKAGKCECTKPENKDGGMPEGWRR